MKRRAGRKSSPLDAIRPDSWQFDDELLDLLWVLEHTVDLFPELARLLDDIIKGPLFVAADFPKPVRAERLGLKGDLPLFENAK